MLDEKSFLSGIRDKVLSRQRITFDEGVRLYEVADLAALGQLADFANRRANGDRVYYNVNHHLNPTNLCILDCAFCAFAARRGDPHAYKLTVEDMLGKVRRAVAAGATEVHIVGGLEPGAKFEEYLDLIAVLHREFPNIHLKAFTVVEIDFFAVRAKKPVEWVLEQLREAGLGSLPGGGAEILAKRVRDIICKGKLSGERWIDLHRIAHKMNIRSNATMLYGHVETIEERVDHMERIRALQDETSGFNVFIPLAFHPENTKIPAAKYTTGQDDLRTLAVSRLYLDNFANIKAYWVMLTEAVAQLALHFGANDMDGTVVEERITHMAGGKTGGRLEHNQIEQIILGAGRIPVQRDTLYRPVAEVA